jgi:NAD+ kinase
MRFEIRSIIIISKLSDDSLVETTKELAMWLLNRDKKLTVYVQDVMSERPEFSDKKLRSEIGKDAGRLKFWTNQMCSRHPQLFDFAITV